MCRIRAAPPHVQSIRRHASSPECRRMISTFRSHPLRSPPLRVFQPQLSFKSHPNDTSLSPSNFPCINSHSPPAHLFAISVYLFAVLPLNPSTDTAHRKLPRSLTRILLPIPYYSPIHPAPSPGNRTSLSISTPMTTPSQSHLLSAWRTPLDSFTRPQAYLTTKLIACPLRP